MTHPPIQVGSQVIAKRASGLNAVGERGVCYEVYQLGGRPGYSFILERGGYDGFSPLCGDLHEGLYAHLPIMRREWNVGVQYRANSADAQGKRARSHLC
jgi:hypothetical protein